MHTEICANDDDFVLNFQNHAQTTTKTLHAWICIFLLKNVFLPGTGMYAKNVHLNANTLGKMNKNGC